MRDGRYRDAEETYARAAVVAPGRRVARFGHLHALFALGRYSHASLVLERIVEDNASWVADPPAPSAVYVAPTVYEKAVSDLRRLVRNENDEDQVPGLAFLLGYVLYAEGQASEAVPFLRSAAVGGAEVSPAAQAVLDLAEKADVSAPGD
jgi:tetratricopeptide (TPR) repeat protein